jgi:alkaline phosphatase
LEDTPRRVILIVADGAGAAHWSLLPLVGASRTLDAFPVTGLVVPRGTSPRVIDSAASATAYAIGMATFNGAIGVGPDSVARETVLEAAQKAGLATGLVTTTSITDATPAAFAAHVPQRELHPDIAVQLVSSGVDVLMGDGLGYFDGTLRPDSQDLLPGLARRYTVVRSRSELATVNAAATPALLGLFASASAPALDPTKPRLAVMTETALAILSRDPDGFFLLIETEGSDEAAHANAPIDELVAIMSDLDEAIRVALRFRERHPETLIVMTADHETGGAALHVGRGGVHALSYTTAGHTAAMVPLFAIGPRANSFAGVHDGDEVGRLLRSAVLGVRIPAADSMARGR